MNDQRAHRRQPERTGDQAVPVRMYEDEDRIMIATPMPGLQANNITVTISDRRVTVHGEQRGPAQQEPNVLLDEWTPGPYHRDVELPQPVNGPGTNCTYGNGVLVVTMMKAKNGQQGKAAELRLTPTEPTHGSYQGHMGSGQSMVQE